METTVNEPRVHTREADVVHTINCIKYARQPIWGIWHEPAEDVECEVIED